MSLFAKAKKARENKKGFTLVELIVVIVILAILAAILVPALLKWIDKARNQQIVVNARNAYVAAQAIGTQEYGKGTASPTEVVKFSSESADDGTMQGDMATLTDGENYKVEVTFDNWKVTKVVYIDNGLSKTATLDKTDGSKSKDSWVVTKN